MRQYSCYKAYEYSIDEYNYNPNYYNSSCYQKDSFYNVANNIIKSAVIPERFYFLYICLFHLFYCLHPCQLLLKYCNIKLNILQVFVLKRQGKENSLN